MVTKKKNQTGRTKARNYATKLWIFEVAQSLIAAICGGLYPLSYTGNENNMYQSLWLDDQQSLRIWQKGGGSFLMLIEGMS